MVQFLYGCTDPNYENYDASATTDDGSCANSYTLNMFDSFGDGWNGNTWTATGTSSGTVYGPYTISTGASATETFSSGDLCFTVVCDGGAWQGEVSWDLLDGSGTTILNGGAPSGTFGTCTYGCTDPNFDSYDATADLDDGSCTNTYTLLMTDSWGDGWNGNEWTATNTSTGIVYGPYTILTGSSGSATFTSSDLETLCHLVVCDGGSFPGEVSWDLQDGSGTSVLAGGAPYTGTTGTCTYGCTDANASNYDANADIDDGSCSYGPCATTTPYHETFSTGLLPVGVCTPNQWATSVVTGDGWRFTGNPGYNASTSSGNNRNQGEFAWIDFSSDDVDPILEVEDVDVSALTNPGLAIDYFSLGTYSCSGYNILHIEAYDGANWVNVSSLQLNVTGWNTYYFSLAGMTNATTGFMEIRFREKVVALHHVTTITTYFLDDVKFENVTLGCTDPSYDNYDASAQADDGSCAMSYTLYMFDSFGDGWNGNTWTATGLNSGTVYSPFTVASCCV